MMTKEEYKRELIRMWDMQRGNDYEGKDTCDGVFCEDCPLSEINNDGRDGCMEPMKVFEIIKIVEMWSKENTPKKYKVSKLEYDIIFTVLDFGTGDEKFSNYKLLTKLLKDGYFEGAKPSDKIADYIKNCEVKEDV